MKLLLESTSRTAAASTISPPSASRTRRTGRASVCLRILTLEGLRRAAGIRVEVVLNGLLRLVLLLLRRVLPLPLGGRRRVLLTGLLDALGFRLLLVAELARVPRDHERFDVLGQPFLDGLAVVQLGVDLGP